MSSNRWIPISDEFPPTDEWVLLRWEEPFHPAGFNVSLGFCAGSVFKRCIANGRFIEDSKSANTTHWMPVSEDDFTPAYRINEFYDYRTERNAYQIVGVGSDNPVSWAAEELCKRHDGIAIFAHIEDAKSFARLNNLRLSE